MSSVNENAHRTPWRLLWSDILILLSSRKEKEDVRPVGLVYGKHASRFRIPRDKHEQRATANWNAWKHLRRPTALLAPAPAAAAVVPVQDVTTFRVSKGRGQHFAAGQLQDSSDRLVHRIARARSSSRGTPPHPGLCLIATSRFSLVSLARSTSPIPPAPRAETVSYGP